MSVRKQKKYSLINVIIDVMIFRYINENIFTFHKELWKNIWEKRIRKWDIKKENILTQKTLILWFFHLHNVIYHTIYVNFEKIAGFKRVCGTLKGFCNKIFLYKISLN